MLVLIKLAYAAGLASLLVLLVAFGVKTLYTAPDGPPYPTPPAIRAPVMVTPSPGPATAPATVVTATPEELARYEQEQRDYEKAYDRYVDDRREYRRNVFLFAAFAAVAASAGGAFLWRRADAISLGLVAGGFATLLYGIMQADGDLAEISPALIFFVALAGLVLVLAAGYRWLAEREPSKD